MGRRWNRTLVLALGVAAFVAAAPAIAQEVRIISVDGQLAPDGRAGPVQAWPGQVVSLTADEVWFERGQVEYAYRPVEDFVWTANDVAGDVCDPEQDCRRVSNFEATEYGVNFYVPRNAPRQFEIRVQSKYGTGSDSIVVVNEARQQAYRDGYDYGLGSYGWWTSIAGERVFVPYAYEDDWTPYVHGHWYWSSFGWTWNSYDPWGHVTDHYGHWRHHGVFGWVWMPDPTWIWRAAVVSWFYGDGWLGWWPYDGGYGHGYPHGYAQGYDDGYWMGYWAGRRVGDYPGRHVRPGATCVAYRDFYVPGGHGHPAARAERGDRGGRGAAEFDIARVRMTDRTLVERNFTDSVRKGDVGAIPGGGSDMKASRQFIAQKSGVVASEVPLKAVNATMGGVRRSGFEPAKPAFQAPESYRGVAERVRTSLGTSGVAAAKPGLGVRASVARNMAAESVTAGTLRPDRGVAPAPTFRGADRSKVQTWAPRARDAASPAVDTRRQVQPQPATPGVREAPNPRTQVRPGAVQDPATLRATPDRAVPAGTSPAWERRPTTIDRETGVRPEIGLPADRTIRPDDSLRPEPGARSTPSREVPDVREWYQRPTPTPSSPATRYTAPQPSRPTVAPQESRPRTEFRAPAPEVRRVVPREVERPRNESVTRPSYGGSSSGSSTPPPTYTPPKPKPSSSPAPGRFGPSPRRR